MAKRHVTIPEPDTEPIQEEMSEEELAEMAVARKAEEARKLAPYRALHEQQNEQDDLLAELLFRETLREMEE